jgi:PAS domain S-box-containing protein
MGLPHTDDWQAPSESEILRRLADKITSMVAYWDAAERCRFANRAYERWFGVTPEALVGRHLSELLGAIYVLNRPYIEGVLRGEAQEFEREIPDPAGGPARHGLVSYLPDVADGVVRGFFVLVIDITGIHRAQLALRASEERVRLTIEEAPIGMALIALDDRFVRVNRALCEIVGYDEAELTALTFGAITHPDDQETGQVLRDQLDRGLIPRYQLAKRVVRKDGMSVDVMLSRSLLHGPDGVPLCSIAQIEDITQRVRAEREQRFLADAGPLLASNLDFEETLTRVADLAVRDIADLCIVDLVEADGSVKRLKVTSRSPAKVRLCEQLAAITVDTRRPSLTREVLDTGRAVLLPSITEETLSLYAQDDAHLTALRGAEIRSMVAVPLLVRDHLVGAMVFISSSSSYGEADLRLAEELARRAALSIENARLYRTARRATQARDDLLGIVAHDLRNPLGTILLQASLLRERVSGIDPDIRRTADSIERSARRMNRLIQDLLDVARMEAGRLTVDPAALAIGPFVQEVAEGQRPGVTAAGLELHVETTEALPEVWADRHRLLQVFENLIGNAIKFTPPGGRISIVATTQGEELCCQVIDSGRGIQPDDVPRLFDPYWQGKEGRRLGTGLGLPIVKGIIEAHHGKVWVESTPGQGSTFSFTLPTCPTMSA